MRKNNQNITKIGNLGFMKFIGINADVVNFSIFMKEKKEVLQFLNQEKKHQIDFIVNIEFLLQL